MIRVILLLLIPTVFSDTTPFFGLISEQNIEDCAENVENTIEKGRRKIGVEIIEKCVEYNLEIFVITKEMEEKEGKNIESLYTFLKSEFVAKTVTQKQRVVVFKDGLKNEVSYRIVLAYSPKDSFEKKIRILPQTLLGTDIKEVGNLVNSGFEAKSSARIMGLLFIYIAIEAIVSIM